MSYFPPEIFQKTCIIANDGTVEFTHNKKRFHLTSDCFVGLIGKTVLIDSGMMVLRSDKKIGTARPV